MLEATQPQAKPTPVSLTKSAFSQRHSVSPRTVDYWRDKGLPFLLVSTRKILIPTAEGDAWVKDKFLVASKRRVTLRQTPAATTAAGGAA